MSVSPYDVSLDKTAANFSALTPIDFLPRAAAIYPERTAVIHGARRYSYAELHERSRKLASALRRRGIGKGDTVAFMAPNVPELLEAHYGVPMSGAVLNALNTRLDAPAIAFILAHGEAKVLFTDKEFSPVIEAALEGLDSRPVVIDIDDSEYGGEGKLVGEKDYEAFLEEGDAADDWQRPADEWDALSLNYTSGTTGNPKGVVYAHRGAFLTTVGNILTWGMAGHPVYLWTLPMFHCNGWCFTWSVCALAGTHVCLRRVEPAAIYRAIADHGVSHFCGAPIVLGLIINASDGDRVAFDHRVDIMTAAAPPPAAVIARMEEMGFSITHVYGLTEVYGPAVVCAWKDEWNPLPVAEQARLKARQGVRYSVLEDLTVMDAASMTRVPADGTTMGEVMFKGNVVMRGYLKNPDATDESFAGGWFHSGDLGVMHADGYIELKDRAKDIIISGGENISTIEVESVLYKHPAIMEAAVVARPDAKWGETPCAFVTLKSGQDASADEIIAFCRDNLAHFKAPKTVVFGELPKTSTGKVQKFVLRDRAADFER